MRDRGSAPSDEADLATHETEDLDNSSAKDKENRKEATRTILRALKNAIRQAARTSRGTHIQRNRGLEVTANLMEVNPPQSLS